MRMRTKAVALCATLALSMLVGPSALADPPPPPFVPGWAGVQNVPGMGQSFHTFCLAPPWPGAPGSKLRQFESQNAGYNSYAFTVVDVSQRPPSDPWACPS